MRIGSIIIFSSDRLDLQDTSLTSPESWRTRRSTWSCWRAGCRSRWLRRPGGSCATAPRTTAGPRAHSTPNATTGGPQSLISGSASTSLAASRTSTGVSTSRAVYDIIHDVYGWSSISSLGAWFSLYIFGSFTDMEWVSAERYMVSYIVYMAK